MGNTAKDLPEEIRPYERCLKEGPEALNDAELLAVVLRTGSMGENSLQLAQRLLSMTGLAELTSMAVPELSAVKGIGKVKAIQLQCAGELGRRAVRNQSEAVCFDTPQAIGDHYLPRFSGSRQEEVLLLNLNTKNRLIRELVLSRGTVCQTLLSPREVFLEALRYNAVKIILLHNHPSGDPTPSLEDIEITHMIEEAGKLLAVPLADHIIIGGSSFISLKEMGYIT